LTEPESIFRNRNFVLYFTGTVLSETGVRGTLAINLYHIFLLSNSTALVGLVGIFQFVPLLALAPFGGVIADRLDRRRLLQIAQLLSLGVGTALAAVTFAGIVSTWHIYVSVLLISAANAFDAPARRALLPALVPDEQLTRALSLVTPAREISLLAGPALGGVLVAVGGPGLMYAVGAASYGVLVVMLAIMRVPHRSYRPVAEQSMWGSIREGLGYVQHRAIIWQLMALDLIANVFGAYRVILPALAATVLMVDVTGYGLLAASVPCGALLGSFAMYRHMYRWRSGRVVLWAAAGYGVACVALAQSTTLALAIAAGVVLGGLDALGATVRATTILLEAPDALRGRVSSLVHMATRGGPAIGSVNIGLLSSVLGPVGALTAGALFPIASAIFAACASSELRNYRGPAASTQ
jgi:MFS family permease